MQSFRFLLAFLTALYCVSTLAAIEEVVVTAQKRAESVQDVRISPYSRISSLARKSAAAKPSPRPSVACTKRISASSSTITPG